MIEPNKKVDLDKSKYDKRNNKIADILDIPYRNVRYCIRKCNRIKG